MANEIYLSQPQATPRMNLVTFWRTDAVVTLLTGDLMIFATGTWIDVMGMSSSMTTPLRLLGGYFIVYALWQLWMARSGTVSKNAYLIADVEMSVFGVLMMGAIVAGVQLNTLGVIFFGGLCGVGAFFLAGLWYYAYRQA